MINRFARLVINSSVSGSFLMIKEINSSETERSSGGILGFLAKARATKHHVLIANSGEVTQGLNLLGMCPDQS